MMEVAEQQHRKPKCRLLIEDTRQNPTLARAGVWEQDAGRHRTAAQAVRKLFPSHFQANYWLHSNTQEEGR
jgi:hypothetical protein